MSKDRENPKPEVTIGRTPQGQIAAATPRTARPPVARTWGAMYNLLGDPNDRYGRLLDPAKVSMATKLQMLSDPVIAITMAYVSSKLVKAEYEILCADAEIRDFFVAMYAAFHREFMLQAAMATALGCSGLIKKLEFAEPKPIEVDGPPVWTSAVTPFICTGFDQVSPIGSYPTFDEDGRYTGFEHAGGQVDRIYSLWITIGRAKAFGKYSGWGRLNNAYKMWWLGEFGYDQLAVHLHKFVDRVILARFPPGKTDDGQDFADIAIARGDDTRAGATVALPSEVYAVTDPASGGERLSAIYKWAMELLESAENIGAFLSLADHVDSRKAMAMLLPLQTYQQVRQSALGGPTTSDVLGELATDLIVEEATDIDLHLNEYLFPYIREVNFGPDAPPVIKRTTGLNEADRGEMFELIKLVLARAGSPDADRVDVDALAHRLDIPLRRRPPRPRQEPPAEEEQEEEEPVTDEQQPTETPAAGQPEQEAQAALAAQVDSTYDPKLNPSDEALMQMIADPVPDDDTAAATITEDDLERVARLLEKYPELADLETVEVVERGE